MPQADEPTIGEVIRRLDSIAAQLTEVVREIKDDRSTNAKTFVRQDVYHTQRVADQAIVANFHADLGVLKTDFERELGTVKAERSSDVAFRRQVILGFTIAGIGWLASVALFVANILAR